MRIPYLRTRKHQGVIAIMAVPYLLTQPIQGEHILLNRKECSTLSLKGLKTTLRPNKTSVLLQILRIRSRREGTAV